MHCYRTQTYLQAVSWARALILSSASISVLMIIVIANIISMCTVVLYIIEFIDSWFCFPLSTMCCFPCFLSSLLLWGLGGEKSWPTASDLPATTLWMWPEDIPRSLRRKLMNWLNWLATCSYCYTIALLARTIEWCQLRHVRPLSNMKVALVRRSFSHGEQLAKKRHGISD